MQFKLTFVLSTFALLASSTLGSPVVTQCGNNAAVDPALERQVQERIATLRAAGQVAATIPVYWHTVTDGSSGNVPSSGVSASIQVLNDEYAGTGFSFTLAGSDTTVNANWFNNVNQGTAAEDAMKSSLRRGGSNALNVYTVNFVGGLLGYATFPWSYTSDPSNDGVVIQWNSYPGGSLTNYNTGKTLVHEAGHWFGLYHVFQGGCSGSGDGVSDTPPQSTASRGCNTAQDSCAGGGLDSVRNHMDYSSETCRIDFSAGQISRMNSLTSSYRL